MWGVVVVVTTYSLSCTHPHTDTYTHLPHECLSLHFFHLSFSKSSGIGSDPNTSPPQYLPAGPLGMQHLIPPWPAELRVSGW